MRHMNKETEQTVLEGYRKIAFADISDPVRLLFCDEITAARLKKMDLFSIAEIKRPKGGGMEIKFFDRIRALQCMQQLGQEETGGSEIYMALEKGSQALRGDDE